MPPKALSIVARSGTGKTTLLERLIPALKARGVRLGVIKNDAHRFEIDHPGKDSHRLFAAGADTMVITSADKMAMVRRHDAPPPMDELVARWFFDADLVLTEGFKRGHLPKIEVHRLALGPEMLCRGEVDDPTLIAVVSDEPLEVGVPVLPLDDVEAVADFVMAWYRAA